MVDFNSYYNERTVKIPSARGFSKYWISSTLAVINDDNDSDIRDRRVNGVETSIMFQSTEDSLETKMQSSTIKVERVVKEKGIVIDSQVEVFTY